MESEILVWVFIMFSSSICFDRIYIVKRAMEIKMNRIRIRAQQKGLWFESQLGEMAFFFVEFACTPDVCLHGFPFGAPVSH